MTASIPDEFDSPVGQLSGYTVLKSGRYARITSAAAFVNETAPTNETDRLTPMLANKHVDIRSFITADPDHGRPMSLMDLLHQMENAYHQSINSVGAAPTGGTFKLTWEDTGPKQFVLTSDYTLAHTSTTQTITRVGAGAIANGEVVYVSYSTSVGSYVNESVTMTGTTPQHLAHEADNVLVDTIVVNRVSLILTSAPIAYNATPSEVRLAIEAFVPQVFHSAGYDGVRPAVSVTSNASSAPFYPYIVTFQDESVVFPLEVREIGSWAVLLGVDDTALTSGGVADLTVTNLRTDTNWLQSADTTPDLTQSQVETVAGSVQENWIGPAGSGLTSFTVGKDPTRNNWRSGVAVFSGAAVNFNLISRTPLTPVNIEQLNANHALTKINMVIPEWTARSASLDPALCTIQFTSDTNGLFSFEGGSASAESLAVPFTGHMGGSTYFEALLTAFTGSTNWARVTAVKIHIQNGAFGPPAAATRLTFMALRAINFDGVNNWVPTELDVNTRTQAIESPVSLTGAAGDTGLALVSPLIRSVNEYGATNLLGSNNSSADPSLVDGTVSIQFDSGSQVTVAGVEPTNHVILYLRQRHNADDSWDWIHAQLSWGKVTISGTPTFVAFLAVTKATKSAALANTYTDTSVITIPALGLNTDYLFSADISDTTLTLNVNTVDGSGGLGPHYAGTGITSAHFDRIRGRAGWYAQFDTDKDAQVGYLRASNVSFATMRTAVFHSRTPVDGAQLFVAASEPSQLWTDWSLIHANTGAATDDRLEVDTQKKTSEINSYKFIGGGVNTYSGIQSNIIDFDDWTQMYLDFDVWMPASLSAHNGVQQLNISGGPTGGTFKLTHDGAQTAAIPYNATATQVQLALAALGTIGTGNVLCTGGPLPGVVTIKFIDGLAGADISTLTVTNNSLTGGTSPLPIVTQAGVRPQIYLKQPGTEGDYTVGTIGPFNVPFVPGAWSHVRLDLNVLANHAINPHRVQILTQQPSTQTWWVDKFQAAHRSIAWEMRATANGAWVPFLDAINDPKAALHLPPTARGTALQLQARALRSDAWISNYTLKPHYAEPGRLIGFRAPYLDNAGDAPKVIGIPSATEIYTPGP